MNKLLSFLLVVSVAVAATGQPAGAEEAQATDAPAAGPQATADEASLGPYVAIGGGLAFGDLGVGATGVNPRIFHVRNVGPESGSINLRAGYRFHPRLAAELMWEYQTGFDFFVLGESGMLTAWNLAANLKAYLTETQWQPFVVAGMGIGRREADSSFEFVDVKSGQTKSLHDTDQAFVARLGLGVDVALSESWTFGGEAVYVLGSGDLKTLDYATTTLVLAYRFL